MWIRRIHLFSGLFMLPWVLLYGATALLFNHPTYMAGPDTKIEHFSLTDQDADQMPLAMELAKEAVVTAMEQLRNEDSSQCIELSKSPNAIFTRQVSGSIENEERSVSVILNLNNGKGYLRNRVRTPEPDRDSSGNKEGQTKTLEHGLNLSLEQDPVAAFKKCISSQLVPYSLESSELKLRAMPNVEFDAIVDGRKVRMRLTQKQHRRGSGEANRGDKTADPLTDAVYKCNLSIVGHAPRELSTRSFLLRLHMAHGYGVQANSRWFWAIAVDLMFASMCFWGLSGVVMWWQIKRTRKLGFLLLATSAIVATWLAIGMHWQLVHG